MTAVAAGVSHFLAIESCGQCTPCKLDGLELSEHLGRLCRSDSSQADWDRIQTLTDRVGDRARCSLATQHQVVIGSIIERFGPELKTHLSRTTPAVEPTLVAELEGIENGLAVWDERHRSKQPDWTYDQNYSGKVPAELYGDHRHQLPLEE